MKAAYIKLVSPSSNEEVFMDPRRFDDFKKNSLYKECAKSLVVVDDVWCLAMPILFTWKDFVTYNEDATIVNEINLNEIYSGPFSIESACILLGCEWQFD